jgi:hypothetical protein
VTLRGRTDLNRRPTYRVTKELCHPALRESTRIATRLTPSNQTPISARPLGPGRPAGPSNESHRNLLLTRWGMRDHGPEMEPDLEWSGWGGQ